jgi:serine/threonine protein kinase
MAENEEQKKIEIKDFVMDRTINMTPIGKIKLVKSKGNNKYYAFKILEKSQIIKSSLVNQVLNEVKILSTLDHPFIQSFIGYNHNTSYIYLAYELANGGDLFSYLRRVGHFETDQVKFYGSQVILMLEYLHHNNVIHRDIKPENLLLDKNGYLKLTGFDNAKICPERTYTICGTPEYMAPETILGKGHGKGVDWWAFGILLYELFTGITPFTENNPVMMMKSIINEKVHFPEMFEDEDAKSLIRHLLEKDITKRYGVLRGGVNDIKLHKFFQSTDWRGLLSYKVKAQYTPKVTKGGDVDNYPNYDDSDTAAQQVAPEEDPFENW